MSLTITFIIISSRSCDRKKKDIFKKMIFRDSEYKGTSTYAEVVEHLNKDPDIMTDDLKAQFIYMIELLRDSEA